MSDAVTRLNAALEGRYRIDREIGAGGMATVYGATDLRHDRRVAVKVLRPEIAAVVGADRFIAEIKTTANLQHPHILPLFDSGEADGFLFYVMPLVTGESLRELLDRERQLTIDEALDVTRGVASALDYAHRAGIVHRDIKPANILLHDGEPLVADFGIALALSGADQRLTATGMSVGTPHYMSPEQATGDHSVGPRTDIYALGCVLYEMLVGDPPHTGSTPQAVIGKLLADRPVPIRQRRDTVPLHIDSAVLTALARTPADRFTTVERFVAALADPTFRHPAVSDAGSDGRLNRRWRQSALLGWSAAVVAILSAWWGWSRPSGGASTPVLRYSTQLSSVSASSTEVDQFYSSVALSSDGRTEALVREGLLWTRARDDIQGDFVPLTGSDGARNPFFSPDGGRIGFLHPTTATLRTIPIGGGAATTVAEGVGRAGASWGRDDVIYLSMTDDSVGLAMVDAQGGEITPLTRLDAGQGETGHWAPHVLPNGRGLLFSIIGTDGPRSARVAVLDPESGTIHTLVDGVAARYAPSGHLVFATATGTLMAAPFDAEILELAGEAQALLDGVLVGFRAPDLVLSESGTLAYTTSRSGGRPMSELVWVGRNGGWQPIDPGWMRRFGAVTLSPDGSRAAVGIAAGGEEHVWVKQLDQGPETRVTATGGPNYRPAWTHDGHAVGFVSVRGDDRHVFLAPGDGSSEPQLVREGRPAINELHFSPDGEWLVYRTGSGSTGQGRDLHAVRLDGDGTPVTLVATEAAETSPAVSPDGRWLAYTSDRTGQSEVYVRPFPDTDTGRWPVSVEGGAEPVWSHDGSELFYRGPRAMIAVRLAEGPEFAIEDRQVLFSTEGFGPPYEQHAMYGLAPDGRFIMVRPLAEAVGGVELVVIENFHQVLRARFDG